MARAPGKLIDVGGFRLHLNCGGSGSPAAIFDAALGGSSLSWMLVQPDVAAARPASRFAVERTWGSARRSGNRCPRHS